MLAARRWLDLWQRLGAARSADSAVADAYAALIERYAETHRHYHTAQHIAECLAHLDTARALCTHEAEVELALWFHDAIYAPRASDNEANSALWAQRVMREAGLDAGACVRVHALIMKTCHDALPESADEQVLVDIDLAILGADAARFEQYELQVRAEYAWVPQFLFDRTRKKILQGFVERVPLYATAHFRQRLETSARENLQRALSRLA